MLEEFTSGSAVMGITFKILFFDTFEVKKKITEKKMHLFVFQHLQKYYGFRGLCPLTTTTGSAPGPPGAWLF